MFAQCFRFKLASTDLLVVPSERWPDWKSMRIKINKKDFIRFKMKASCFAASFSRYKVNFHAVSQKIITVHFRTTLVLKAHSFHCRVQLVFSLKKSRVQLQKIFVFSFKKSSRSASKNLQWKKKRFFVIKSGETPTGSDIAKKVRERRQQRLSPTADPCANRLHEEGIIFRDERLVSWSCALQSTLSDLEVETRDVPSPIILKLPGYESPVQAGVMYKFAYKLTEPVGALPVMLASLIVLVMLLVCRLCFNRWKQTIVSLTSSKHANVSLILGESSFCSDR